VLRGEDLDTKDSVLNEDWETLSLLLSINNESQLEDFLVNQVCHKSIVVATLQLLGLLIEFLVGETNARLVQFQVLSDLLEKLQ